MSSRKEDGLNHIAGLTTLTPDEKATYETDINNAETIEEIKEYVQNADEISSDKTADAKELAEAKEQASQEVDQYDQLTKEEKDVFKEDIGQATTIEEVEGLVAEAKAFVDERVTAEQSLEAEKQAAKTVIESLSLLSGPAKAALTEAVEQAQRSEEVESILELAQEKEDGLNHIAGLTTLTPDEKATYETDINNAETIEEIKEYVQNADEISSDKTADAKELAEAKVHRKLVEAEIGSIPNNSASSAAAEAELTREELSKSGEFSNPIDDPNNSKAHTPGLINEKPEFPAEELARLLQVERDKAGTYIANLPNLDTSKVNEFKAAIQNAQTVPVIEEIIQAAEALNAKLAQTTPESGNGASTTQPEKPEFEGGTHGLGLINEKPEFPAEELARLLQVERDKAGTYIANLPNLDTSKVNEFKAAIQNAQTVPVIEEIIQAAEALNAKLAQTTPESGNGASTTQPEKPEFEGGTHGLGLINEKPEFPAEELARLLQVERDKAGTYIANLPNLDTSKVNEFKAAIQNAQTVPVIEEIIQAAEALNAKLAQTTPESGNGASTTQPEKPEFEGGTHGLGLINEKPEFPAEELARLLQVERDKAGTYIANLPNLDTSKVNEFKAAIQNAQTVPVIEEIIQAAEALNAKLAQTTPESGNGASTTQPEKPEFEGGTHGLGLINEKPEFPAEELARLLQVERDKAGTYIANLPNLDTSKVNEFKAAIQNAQTVPAIEEIIQAAEALNTKLGRGKVGNEQGKPAESKGPAQSSQVELEKERPTDKPAVTDHLKNLKTEVNAQQSIQASTKQEKSGERLPDTATISWLLGVTGISTLLAGLGLKKKREDDDK
ncbi:hypothetical protein [Dolosigranulum pigrum]|uniref:hypothetical protein n=1 Tax=Dolosigranulum pigrum TaxID=29394 RepID=UPI003137A469